MSYLSKFHSLSNQEKVFFLQAIVSLPLVRIGLKTLGYQRIRRLLSQVGRLQATPQGKQGDIDNIARAAAKMVHRAAQTRIGRANCLPRSLTLWSLLRSQGMDSDFCLGVKKNSRTIEAHAWVEYHGTPLNEGPDVSQQFAPF